MKYNLNDLVDNFRLKSHREHYSAVIIGAMLVSPLMGPIMGMGLAMGINDVPLLRKSLQNFAFAAGFSLITSTLFFNRVRLQLNTISIFFVS